MPPKNTKLILVTCLLLGALLCILGCNTIADVKTTLTPDANGIPIKTLITEIDIDQREELFALLQAFASQNSLDLRSAFYGANRIDFFFVLAGDSFHISVLNTKISPGEINIHFYNEVSPPVSQEKINKLSIDLKTTLSKIPDIVIKEKLLRLRVSIDKNQSQKLSTEFFTQLQNFAERQSLEFIVLAPYNPELRTFLVEINGDDFQITCDAVRNIPGEANVDFYIHYAENGNPTLTSQEIVDKLFNDLKSYFGNLPNVTITELR